MCVSASHIPVTQNTEADSFSRNFNETIGWKLSTHLFPQISSMFGNPTLYLFAFRINHQIDRYISRYLSKIMTIKPSAKNLVQYQDQQKVHPLHQNLHPQVILID